MEGLFRYWPKDVNAKKLIRSRWRSIRLFGHSVVLLPTNDHEARVHSNAIGVRAEIMHATVDGREETLALLGMPPEDTGRLNRLMDLAEVDACIFSDKKRLAIHRRDGNQEDLGLTWWSGRKDILEQAYARLRGATSVSINGGFIMENIRGYAEAARQNREEGDTKRQDQQGEGQG